MVDVSLFFMYPIHHNHVIRYVTINFKVLAEAGYTTLNQIYFNSRVIYNLS